VNTSKLGTHWTTDKGVAEDFATFDTEGYQGPGTIVTAAVHRRHIVGGNERKNLRASHDVFGSDHREKEHPVRAGAVVHVQGVEHYDGNEAVAAPLPSSLSYRRTGRA
jgi:hypothetical protein